ncbi:MAG: hypothetical protein ACD_3C00106G0016 [uncultured bacterium (gcode 4)]|uniref:Uncharacterized protein n=1 Tax=uncultured bacterium (gcode 4) TaxID=1234023 RepID=K2G1G7_9BACT|nr:MAG: hypothetical protein ACD_3C00106G0016 [uncultured bacterium (gcode 4)]
MVLKTEIKEFVKKVMVLWIFLSLFINLLVTWATSTMETDVASAATNDTKFNKVNAWYLWTTWVAVSLNIWTKLKEASATPVTLTTEVLPISFILANKNLSRDKIITSNMVGLNEYLNVLKTNVNSLLDQSRDREAMLESYLDQLRSRFTGTTNQITILREQARQLQETASLSDQKIERLKWDLTTAYRTLDYDKTQSTLDEYLLERDKNTYSKTYLVFLWKFIDSYVILNEYNKVLLDTLINNKEALIKNVTIVMPDSWTNLMKRFNLIKTEAEFKSSMQN